MFKVTLDMNSTDVYMRLRKTKSSGGIVQDPSESTRTLYGRSCKLADMAVLGKCPVQEATYR